MTAITLTIPWFEKREGFESLKPLEPDTHQFKFALHGSSVFRREAQSQLVLGRTTAVLNGRLIVLRNVSVNDRGSALPLICDADYEFEPEF